LRFLLSAYYDTDTTDTSCLVLMMPFGGCLQQHRGVEGVLVILHQLLLFEKEEERVMVAGHCRQLTPRLKDAPSCIL
jgi:hypothetical protein